MDSLETCRQILKRSGSSFALAFRILPERQRDAMTAFYAFCRQVDDDVDREVDPEKARLAIETWKRRIDAVYSGCPDHDSIGHALLWAKDRFSIRKRHLDLIIEGVELDLVRNRFETFEDLYEYCYRVASAVGMVVLSILGAKNGEADLYAELTGLAVQMTNILRDAGEDAANGRIYLPREDLELFGVREGELLQRRMTEPVKRLLRFEAARTRHFYGMAEAALKPEQRHRFYFAEALRETYWMLFRQLEARDFMVFRDRISIGKREKIVVALKHRLHPSVLASNWL
ncbi:MAG: squalene synthase HpnD [Myxococcales bacterium]|nr:MAG: squalene synthase HpnD [Myxococcales bacterium]